MNRVVALLLVTIGLAGTAHAVKRPLHESDLYRFQWVGDPRMSPDGQRVAFTLTECDTTNNGYATSIWLVDIDGNPPVQLTRGPKDSSPRWSPDGRRLAFLRPGEDGGPSQVWLLPLSGGEARPLTHRPGGAGTPRWSPDGFFIAFDAPTLVQERRTDMYPGGWKSDVRVITEPRFRRNGSGFIDPDVRRHLWVVRVSDGELTQVTRGSWNERLVDWSPESSTLFYTSDRRSRPWLSDGDTDLYGVHRTGGDTYQLIDFNGSIGRAGVHRSGRWAMVGSFNGPTARSYEQQDLLVAGPVPRGGRLRDEAVRNVTLDFDRPVTSTVSTDMASPRAAGGWSPVWEENGGSVFVVTTNGGSSSLSRINIDTGAVTTVSPAAGTVRAFSATPDARRFAFLHSSAVRPADVWVVDDDGGALRQLTDFNAELLAEVVVIGPDEMVFPSHDGEEIHGWLMKPHNYVPWETFPMVVEVHGGPHVTYGDDFFLEFQILAGRGNLVLYTNPRGTAGYGNEFAQSIQYAYPGHDIHDILAGVDAVIAKGIVDTTRLGITGGSGGGYLTNWMIVRTDRFAAAATQRCVSEWLSFYATADFTMYTPFWFRKQPWEDPMEYVQRSPVYFAERIRTPLLILHSEDDLRTPINQGEAMFRALRGLDKPAVMVRFPEENHNLSRTGSPHRRVERFRYLAGWFDRYLHGRADTPYGRHMSTRSPSAR